MLSKKLDDEAGGWKLEPVGGLIDCKKLSGIVQETDSRESSTKKKVQSHCYDAREGRGREKQTKWHGPASNKYLKQWPSNEEFWNSGGTTHEGQLEVY